MNEDKIKKDLEEIETINIELDHRVSKLIAENEHLKQTYKQLYDSIKPARIRSKEQCDDLINQVNLKSVEISDLNASLQEKVLVITALKDDLRKLKESSVDKCSHSAYIKHTQEEAAVLRDLVEHVKSNYPLDHSLESACRTHPRTVKSSLKNKNSVVEPKGNANVQHSKLNTNSELLCVKCNGCMLFDNHDLCVLDFINNVNARVKSKSVKKSSKRKVWKPTGKVITTTTEVPLRKPTALENETPKPVVTLVYSRKPRKSKTNVPVSKSKVVQIVLWYLDSGCSKHMTGDRSQLTNFVNKFLGAVQIQNVSRGKGYWDFVDMVIIRLGMLRYQGFTTWKDLDTTYSPLGNNLYTLSLGDMMAPSPICLLSKALKTKSWKWHQHLSHLNFGAINHLARHGLVRGLLKLKFKKDHLCSACAMGKSKKKPHKPKSEDTNQEKLYLLHMDLYGPMRVASVNGKKYILVIVDDYS
ncbi:retrovirus-related pol polyprotein from transposon TNT 1-94 [Tanacetum coccineum]